MPLAPPRYKQQRVGNRQPDRRKTAHERGYDSAWSRYSRQYRRDNPWCVMCLPRLKAAKCVDHIIPVKGKDDPLFYDPDNHQSLCWSCHSTKTAQEDGGFGNRKTKPKGYKTDIGVDGWPTDDKHPFNKGRE